MKRQEPKSHDSGYADVQLGMESKQRNPVGDAVPQRLTPFATPSRSLRRHCFQKPGFELRRYYYTKEQLPVNEPPHIFLQLRYETIRRAASSNFHAPFRASTARRSRLLTLCRETNCV